MKFALLSTAVVAAVATFGDWVWAAFLSQHLVVAGMVHGALLCLAMGAMLALPACRAEAGMRRRRGRRVVLGAAAGIGVGIAAAGFFYLLAPMLRMWAMLPAWFALWVMLSVVTRALGVAPRTWGETLARGVLAGLLSGTAFYLVADMWTAWDPSRINYVEHLARWAFAFAPGFLALQASRTAPV